MTDPLAVTAFRALGALFLELPPGWTRTRLVELHRGNRATVTAMFEAKRGLAELVLRNPEQLYATCWDAADIMDPLNLKNASSLLALLLEDYVPVFDDGERVEVEAELEHALECTTASLARTVDAEIQALVELFRNILNALGALPGLKEYGRVVLPELPVGNSIPCKLLEPLLAREGYKVVTTRVALSRNDARSKGARREDLLAESLVGVGVQENDLVLYVDEWFSGINYARLCGCIENILSKHPGVHFLPAAMVKMQRARAEGRYEEFVAVHAKRASKLTASPERLRVSIPPTPSQFVADTEFFWSEHDRTSGYRKMQLLGSIFSSFDAGIEELHLHPELLVDAMGRCIAYLADKGVEVPVEVTGDSAAWTTFFEDGYADYTKRRNEIAKLDHMSNLGECETFESALEEVLSVVADVVKGTPAERCLTVAAFYARRRDRPQVDPEDRYYFKTHAPIIEDLPPRVRRYHERLMEHLRRRVDQLMA